MFKKLWNKIKNSAGAIIGFAIGGPFGAALGQFLQEIMNDIEWRGTLMPHLQNQLDKWLEQVFEPLGVDLVVAFNNLTSEELTHPQNIERINKVLKEVTTLKAYSEFKISRGAADDDYILHIEKIKACNQFLSQILELYTDAVGSANTNYRLDNISVVFSNIKSVSGKNLDWERAVITGTFYGFIEKATNAINKPTPSRAPVSEKPSQEKPIVISDTPTRKPQPTQPTPQPTPTRPETPPQTTVVVTPEKQPTTTAVVENKQPTQKAGGGILPWVLGALALGMLLRGR